MALGVRPEFAPQVADVHVEAAVVAAKGLAQGNARQRLTIDQLPGLLHQRPQDQGFALGELQWLIV